MRVRASPPTPREREKQVYIADLSRIREGFPNGLFAPPQKSSLAANEYEGYFPKTSRTS